jgi:hypothetical protein
MVFVKLMERFRRLLRAQPPLPQIVQPCRRPSASPLQLVSSSTTSSPASPSLSRLFHLLYQAGCINIFCPVVLLRLRPPWRPFLLVPQTMTCLVIPSTLHVRYQHPRRVLGSGKPDARIATAALTSSSALIFLPDNYLSASLSLSTALSLMCHHLLWRPPSCAYGFICGSLVFSNLDSYIDHGYPTHGILDHGYSPSSRLPRHRHKGL